MAEENERRMKGEEEGKAGEGNERREKGSGIQKERDRRGI